MRRVFAEQVPIVKIKKNSFASGDGGKLGQNLFMLDDSEKQDAQSD